MPGICARCNCPVYCAEERCAIGKVWHNFCFSCCECKKLLDSSSYESDGQELYCKTCLRWRSNAPDCFCDDDCGDQIPQCRPYSTSCGPNYCGRVYPQVRVSCGPSNSIYTQSSNACTNTVYSQQYLKKSCGQPPCPVSPCRKPSKCRCCEKKNRSRLCSLNDSRCQKCNVQQPCPSNQKIQVYLNTGCEEKPCRKMCCEKVQRCSTPPPCRVRCVSPPACHSRCDSPPPCRVRCNTPPPCRVTKPCRVRCESPVPCQSRCNSPPPCRVRCDSPPPCRVRCNSPPPCRVRCKSPRPCPPRYQVNCCPPSDCPPASCLLNASANRNQRCRKCCPKSWDCETPPRCQDNCKVRMNPCRLTQRPCCSPTQCDPIVVCSNGSPSCVVPVCSTPCNPCNKPCNHCCNSQKDPLFSLEILMPSENDSTCHSSC